ncbi:hypothetical protein Tco_1390888 [Tanacetum coccineum]
MTTTTMITANNRIEGKKPSGPMLLPQLKTVGTAPVARAPYRLAPSKMQELSNQLQELSDRGVRVSTSKIDLRLAINQLKVMVEGIPTTFRTRYGHYEFQVMPFGLTNVPAVFMEHMNRYVNTYLDKFVIVVHRMIFLSNSRKQHKEHQII